MENAADYALDILDFVPRRLLSLDTDFARYASVESLDLNERFRGETEEERFYREAMELRK